MEEKIFEINGIKYKRSKDNVKDGDELYVILKADSIREGCKTTYGDKGKLDMWYDRVIFPNGEEFVYWSDEFAKLELVE